MDIFDIGTHYPIDWIDLRMSGLFSQVPTSLLDAIAHAKLARVNMRILLVVSSTASHV